MALGDSCDRPASRGRPPPRLIIARRESRCRAGCVTGANWRHFDSSSSRQPAGGQSSRDGRKESRPIGRPAYSDTSAVIGPFASGDMQPDSP